MNQSTRATGVEREGHAVPAERAAGDGSAALQTAAALLPGLLLGAQVAGLLFFLNPELPFSMPAVVNGVLRYGILLGLLTTALLLPITWRRPRRSRRIFPWMMTLALALAALLDWAQAAHFGFFLPPGINARLIKAAILLSLAALIFFYTALLHTLNRRPYGLRSRVGLTLVALASVYVMLERREAFRPRPVAAPLPSLIESTSRPQLLVIGLDGATLDAIIPLAERGELPFLSSLLESGSVGRLRTLEPTRRLALWTTIASGKFPYRHGVLGDFVYPSDHIAPASRLRLIPEGIGFEAWGLFGRSPAPTSARDRQASAAWEVLDRLGVPTGVIGWPSVAPVPTGLRGYAFAESYFSGNVRSQTTYPDEWAERGLLFRQPENQVELHLAVGPTDRLPRQVLGTLARDLWRETLATFLIEQRPDVRATFLLLPGLGEVSQRYFSGFNGVHFDGVQEARFLEAAQIVTAYYRHLDEYIADLWSRGEGPRVLAVLSAYGMEAQSGLRKITSRWLQDAALEGRPQRAPDGLFLIAGEGVEEGKRLADVSLVDVLPTLLYALRVPIARDLDGRVVTEAFTGAHLARNPLTFVPSYEALRELDDTLEPQRPPTLSSADGATGGR